MVGGPAPPSLSTMKRCARCQDPAGVVLWFSYRERTAWLGDPDGGFDRFRHHPRCHRHTDRLVSPGGWHLNDNRAARPRPLFLADAVYVADAA